MIILFEENETTFTSLGLGTLPDANSCYVKETLNDIFELDMSYPIIGKNYDKLKINRIILCNPNPYNTPQPFRISSISRPINGIVSIHAMHISYDMNGIVCGPVSGNSLQDTLDKIENASLLKHNFKLYTDQGNNKTFKTNGYFNMRALLLGSSDSVLDKYKGEIYFDKFNLYILKHRGSNKGAQVRYSKNLKDITHEISYDRLYNKVYPFYHKETSSKTATKTTDGFKQVYIVGHKPYQDGWLSYSKDGEPYHPINESPVQVATEGNFFQKVYTWSETTERYSERIYNEAVTLIDQVGQILNSSNVPSWIYIDWTGLPNIICKANADGYFKLVTESKWTFHKKGDIIFENTIKEVATNLVIYFSEVIPTTSSSELEDSTSVTHVELKDKIITLTTDAAKEMKFDRVLTLDLTSEFDETPTLDKLELKAKEYIEKKKIGQYKYNTTLSFIDLSSTTEGIELDKTDNIELGDTIKVVYDDLGVNLDLRVITTSYDVLQDRYSKIDLGESPDTLSAESIQNGDNVSSLTNDVGFADVNTVNKLIAKTITADYIKAINAELSKAQIEELTTARIKVTGLIEATQFELDKLVAKMLIADNAVIKETLEAGKIKVKGDISVTSGEISIQNDDGTKVFKVTREGDLTANSVNITGGELNINDNFIVGIDGIMIAKGAEIEGSINIDKGSININDRFIVDPSGNVTIKSGFISISNSIGTKFEVTSNGFLTAKKAKIDGDITITSGQISIQKKNGDQVETSFVVDQNGKVTANSVAITGGSLDIGKLDNGTYNFSVTSDGAVTIKNGSVNITSGSIKLGDSFIVTDEGVVLINKGTINLGKQLGNSYNFSVTDEGIVSINKGAINLGAIKDISNKITGYRFSVTDEGIVSINKGAINLGVILDESGNPTDKYNFSVTDAGEVSIINGSIRLGLQDDNSYNFSVGNDGILHVKGIDMTGGTVSGSTISNGSIAIGKLKANADGASIGKLASTNSGTTLGGVSVNDKGTTMSVGNGTIQSGSKFGVTNTGVLTAYGAIIYGSVHILDGEIDLFKSNPDTHVVESKFHVSPDGVITATAGTIGGFTITDDKLESEGSGVIVSTTQLKYSDNFTVDDKGAVSIKSGEISLGKYEPYPGREKYHFKVTNNGSITISNVRPTPNGKEEVTTKIGQYGRPGITFSDDDGNNGLDNFGLWSYNFGKGLRIYYDNDDQWDNVFQIIKMNDSAILIAFGTNSAYGGEKPYSALILGNDGNIYCPTGRFINETDPGYVDWTKWNSIE